MHDVVEPLGASTLPQSVVPVPSQFGHSLPAPPSTDSAFGELDLDLDNPGIGRPTSPGELDVDPVLPAASPRTSRRRRTRCRWWPTNPQPQADKRDEPLPFDLSGISLDLDKTGGSAAVTRPMTADMELPSIDAGPDTGPTACTTRWSRKLELAEEFRQIGDKDGARDLLREVLAKASGATPAKAQGMLDDLG